VVPPEVKVPQGMELREVVHPLLEYTPKFADVDTTPVEDTLVDVVMAAKVLSVKTIPIMINATIAVVIEIFRFAIIISSQNNYYIKS